MTRPEVTMEKGGKGCVITLECDHSERTDTAEWFNETVLCLPDPDEVVLVVLYI